MSQFFYKKQQQQYLKSQSRKPFCPLTSDILYFEFIPTFLFSLVSEDDHAERSDVVCLEPQGFDLECPDDDTDGSCTLELCNASWNVRGSDSHDGQHCSNTSPETTYVPCHVCQAFSWPNWNSLADYLLSFRSFRNFRVRVPSGFDYLVHALAWSNEVEVISHCNSLLFNGGYYDLDYPHAAEYLYHYFTRGNFIWPHAQHRAFNISRPTYSSVASVTRYECLSPDEGGNRGIVDPGTSTSDSSTTSQTVQSDDLDARDTSEAGASQVQAESTNVLLTENRGETLARPGPEIQESVSQISFSLPPGTFGQFTDRWNNLGTFTWGTGEQDSKIFKSYDLPRDLIPVLLKNPATLPLLQYNFWQPQITLRFQLNSTRFHQGMLIIGVKYYSAASASSNRIPTTAQELWQLDYATLRANISNVAEIKIPFLSFLDMIPIRLGAVGSSCYYASVYVGVASPLLTGAGSCEEVTVTVQAKLSIDDHPTLFFGQVSREPVTTASANMEAIYQGKEPLFLEPQGMESVISTIAKVGQTAKSIGNAVESLYQGAGSLFKTSNQDKPIVPLEATKFIDVPTVSLSAGEGATISTPLRLNPATCTPHHPSTVPTGTTTLSVPAITSKWGYVTKFTITTQDPPNRLLTSIPISPMLGYQNVNTLPTPLAGVAGQYMYWAGTIEYKFIVVKADPHSVRLRISTNPGNNYLESVEDRLVDLVSTIQDFQEVGEVTYPVPHLAPTKFVPTVYDSKLVNTGYIQVRLESKLICMASVATQCEIIVLIRAPEMQFAVPRSVFWRPMITTNPPYEWEYTFTNVQEVAAQDWDFVRYYPSGSSKEELVVGASRLYSEGTRHTFSCYGLENPAPSEASRFRMEEITGLFIIDLYHERLTGDAVSYPWVRYDLQQGDGSVYTVWRLSPETANGKVFRFLNVITELQPQGMERSDPGNLQGPSSTTIPNVSQLVLGENFPLKSSLRRYQMVASGQLSASGDGLYTLIYDVNYGSIRSRVSGEIVDNLTFNHDGFRFGKGSLNYNFIMSRVNGQAGKIKARVYHKPPGLDSEVILSPDFVKSDVDLSESLSFFGHEQIGNNYHSIPFTIPYYNYVKYLVNGYDPNIAGIASNSAYSMGQVVIILECQSNTKVNWRLERALGDDADLYCFQGWPYCQDVHQFTNYNEFVPLPSSSRQLSSYILPFHDDPVPLQPQGLESDDLQPPEEEEAFNQDNITLFDLVCVTMPKSHRRNKALRKYLKLQDQLLTRTTAQEDGDELMLTPEQFLAAQHYFSEMARSYTDKVTFRAPIPVELEEIITDEEFNISHLQFKEGENNDLALAGMVSAARQFLARYHNSPTTFFEATGIAQTNSDILSYLKRSASTALKFLPSALKTTFENVLSTTGTTKDVITTVIKGLWKGIKNPMLAFRIIADLQMLLLATDAWVKGVAICSLLAIFGWLDLKMMLCAGLVVQLMCAARSKHNGYMVVYANSADGPPPSENEQFRRSIAAWATALMAGASATLGFKSAKTWHEGVERFARTFGYVGQSWFSVLTNSCSFVLDYIIWVLGLEKPDLSDLANLKNNPVNLDKWGADVVQITEPAIRQHVLSTPKMRDEVCRLYNDGAKVVRLLLSDPQPTTRTGPFLSLWRSLSDLYAQTGEISSAASNNTTPFCIWLYGAPGVGKSELAKHYATEIAKALEITYEGDPFFVRTPRPYWEGYTNQPVVIFDDALQVKSPETLKSFYTDWFGLLTNAPYMPEFAHLEEKKRFVSPKIVIVCSNVQTPSGLTDISNADAFNRRRDVLIECSFTEEFKNKFKDIKTVADPRVIENNYNLDLYQHLRFGHCDNVLDPSARPVKYYDFKQSINISSKLAIQRQKQRAIAAEKQKTLASSLSVASVAETRRMMIEAVTDGESQETVSGIVSDMVANIVSTSVDTVPTAEAEEQGDERTLPTLDQIREAVNTPSTSSETPPEASQSPSTSTTPLPGVRPLRDATFLERLPMKEQTRRKEDPTAYEEDPYKPFLTYPMMTSGECMYHCSTLPIICSCKLPKMWKSNITPCPKCGTCIFWDFDSAFPAKLIGRPSSVACCSVTDYKRRRQELVLNLLQKNYGVLGSSLYERMVPSPIRRSTTRRTFPSLKPLADWIKNKISNFWSMIPLWFIIPFVIGVGAVFLFNTFSTFEKIKKLFSMGEADDGVPKQYQVNYGGKSNFNHVIHEANIASSGSVRTSNKAPTPFNIRPQVHVGQESSSSVISRVKQNIYKLTVIWEDNSFSHMYGTFIKGRIAIQPFHLFVQPLQPRELQLQFPHMKDGQGNPISINLTPQDLEIIRLAPYSNEAPFDLCVIMFHNKRIPLRKDITSILLRDTKLNQLTRTGVFYDVSDDTSQVVNFKPYANRISYKEKGMKATLHGFAYPIQGRGKCGSLLVDANSGILIGMHIAGDTVSNGFAVRLCLEDLPDCVFQEPLAAEIPELPAGGVLQSQGSIVQLGVTDKPISQPMRSKIKPSVCHEVLTPPVRSPVNYRTEGEATPGITKLAIGVKEMATETIPWDPEMIQEVTKWRRSKILAMQPVVQEVGVKSIDIAIFGIPGHPGYEPLKMNTSVGWPLCTNPGASNKAKFTEYEEQPDGLKYVGMDPELEALYQDEIEKRKKGIVPFSPYVLFMKDERLKPGKNPRLIEGCPYQQTIIFRQYFQDFFAAYTLARKDVNSNLCVGINVHGPEWSELARDLLEKGDKICCGDYKRFGPSLDPQLVLEFVNNINFWYNKYQTVNRESLPEDNLVRLTLFESLAFSQCVTFDTVIQTLRGSPSGNPATVQINSEVNMMMLGLAWLSALGNTTIGSLRYFDELTCTKVYGDDMIFSVDPYIEEIWNNEILELTFAKQNIRFTDADKYGKLRKYCNILEAQFLKCHFVPHPTRGHGFYLAGLEKPMIEDIPNWIREPIHDALQQSIENSVTAAELAYAWGYEYYEEICHKLESYWNERGVTLPIRSWGYLDKLFFDELEVIQLDKYRDPRNYDWC